MNQIAGKTVEEALVQLRFSKKKVARDVWKGLKMARDEAIVARGMGLGKVQHEPSEEEWKAIQEEAAQKKADKIVETAQKEADNKAAREAHRSKDPKALENWNVKQKEAKQEEHERRLEQLAANDSVNLTPTEKLELLLPDGMRRPTKAGKATLIELKDGRSKRVHDPSEMYVDQAWVGRGTPGKSVEFRARGQSNILQHRTTCKPNPFLNAQCKWTDANAVFSRFLSCAQGGEDADAHLGRDQEEAREQETLGRSTRQTRHCSATILLVVVS
jgi:ribosomal protein L22